jgi:hypothetical protein
MTLLPIVEKMYEWGNGEWSKLNENIIISKKENNKVFSSYGSFAIHHPIFQTNTF